MKGHRNDKQKVENRKELTNRQVWQFNTIFRNMHVIRRPKGRGKGLRGSLKLPFWPITDFIHCLHVAIHAVCGPLASLLMKITAVKTNLVVAMYPICSWRTSG